MGHIITSSNKSPIAGGKPLRVLISSDVHRGFSQKTAAIHSLWAKELEMMDFDIILLTGDLGTSRKNHFKESLVFFKKLAMGRPVLFVRGNHDFHEFVYNHHDNRYVIKQNSFRAMLKQQDEWFEEIGVHHLEKGPFETESAVFVGWDGWFGLNLQEIDELKKICELRFKYTKQFESLVFKDSFEKKGKSKLSRGLYDERSGFSAGWKDREIKYISPPTDAEKIAPWIDGMRTFDWLRNHSEEAFERALVYAEQARLKNPDKTIVAATHMPPYFDSDRDRIHSGSYPQLERISHTIDFLCHGHSHLFCDEYRLGVKVLNAGSDYDKPNFIILKI